MASRYDIIGVNYSNLREPDARIAALIDRHLGTAKTVLNVGAGAGSYEPAGRRVTAVEPSIEMIGQRSSSDTIVVQGVAEKLPFDDQSFDASMAVLTVHHWSDQAKGMREMRRATRGLVVILTYDPAFTNFWLADYIPELITLDEAKMPRLSDYENWLGLVEILPVPIPHDCTYGFLSGYWRRPKAYLDPKIRAAISSFWAIGKISEALTRLEGDIKNGVWANRYAELLDMEELDCGYRLVIA